MGEFHRLIGEFLMAFIAGGLRVTEVGEVLIRSRLARQERIQMGSFAVMARGRELALTTGPRLSA